MFRDDKSEPPSVATNSNSNTLIQPTEDNLYSDTTWLTLMDVDVLVQSRCLFVSDLISSTWSGLMLQ